MTTTQDKHVADNATPWGRFTLVSKDPAEDRDHIYFTNKVTTIGRNKRRCDLVINQLFISSMVDGTDETSKPIVKLHDHSRNGIWVNADRVGKGASMRLDSGFTVHFTKPGTTPAGVTPMVYKFEFLNLQSSLLDSLEREAHEVLEDVDMTVVADESFEATQLAASVNPSSPSKKKRKRMDEDSVAVADVTHALESELVATKRKVEIVESKLKADAQVILKEGLEQTVQAQADKLAKENVDLMAELKASTAENLQLTKDKDVEVKKGEATAKSLKAALKMNVELKEEAVTNERAMELKLKQSLAKTFEADSEAKSQEMAAKLKEATKKYQQKVDAEHYEKRKEMSEKMAAYANENETLHRALGMKNEELVECEAKIACLQDRITALEGKVDILSAKEKDVAEFKEKVAELEEKLSVSKDESAEILGLLAAAEEKIVTAENKAAKADIAAARTNASNSMDASERHELQKSISSLREELKACRAQLASRDEGATTSRATGAPASIAAESITQGEDAVALRARLATALKLFTQMQALGLQGVGLTTMTKSSKLDDRHLLPAASAELKRNNNAAVPNATSSMPAGDGQDEPKESPEETTAKKRVTTFPRACSKAKVKRPMESANETVESKTSPSRLKPEKQSTMPTASLSAALEADTTSTNAVIHSVDGKCLPSDAIATAINGDGEGDDWDMVD